ncbi:uncharacterized protein [Triticum aestivum]|uniref:uncharacterized protein n=1 Tax=Triticum aestivum TaxID=4565 RepID=UPI001D025B6E|nr:uncharacterized protein LOC123097077 [Triticum aestivum]
MAILQNKPHNLKTNTNRFLTPSSSSAPRPRVAWGRRPPAAKFAAASKDLLRLSRPGTAPPPPPRNCTVEIPSRRDPLRVAATQDLHLPIVRVSSEPPATIRWTRRSHARLGGAGGALPVLPLLHCACSDLDLGGALLLHSCFSPAAGGALDVLVLLLCPCLVWWASGMVTTMRWEARRWLPSGLGKMKWGFAVGTSWPFYICIYICNGW